MRNDFAPAPKPFGFATRTSLERPADDPALRKKTLFRARDDDVERHAVGAGSLARQIALGLQTVVPRCGQAESSLDESPSRPKANQWRESETNQRVVKAGKSPRQEELNELDADCEPGHHDEGDELAKHPQDLA